MERQAGLGRSLEDVLDSLAPVESDPAGPGRLLFEPEDVQQQLDQLMADVAALRERVQHLVSLVPEDAVPALAEPDAKQREHKSKKSHKDKHKKKGRKKHGNRHDA